MGKEQRVENMIEDLKNLFHSAPHWDTWLKNLNYFSYHTVA